MLIYIYIKHRKEINQYYGYAIKHGFCSKEDANWIERTKYWVRYSDYDPADHLEY